MTVVILPIRSMMGFPYIWYQEFEGPLLCRDFDIPWAGDAGEQEDDWLKKKKLKGLEGRRGQYLKEKKEKEKEKQKEEEERPERKKMEGKEGEEEKEELQSKLSLEGHFPQATSQRLSF